MINLREVEEAIKQLENSAATYNNCTKLASLYIVRDELMKKQGQYGSHSYGYYPYYERGGQRGSSSYGYRPMMYNNDDLIIKHDGMNEPNHM